jgi:hypothetical protein
MIMPGRAPWCYANLNTIQGYAEELTQSLASLDWNLMLRDRRHESHPNY